MSTPDNSRDLTNVSDQDQEEFLSPATQRSDSDGFQMGIASSNNGRVDSKRSYFQTDREKKLFVAFLISFVLALSVIVVLVVESHLTKSNVCLDDGCVILAGNMLSSINQSADPCEDFYEYACGNWAELHPRPSDKARWSAFSVLSEQNSYDVKGVLDDFTATFNTTEAVPTDAISKAALFYLTCLDEDAIEEQQIDIIQSLITTDVEWDVTSSDAHTWTDESRLSLTNAIAKVHKDWEASMFNIWIGPDDRQSDTNIPQISQSGLGLPSKEYYEKADDDVAIVAYKEYISQLLQMTYEVDAASGAGTANEIYEFEKKLSEITVDKELLRDPEATYNKMSAEDLSLSYPFIDWSVYLKSIFGDEFLDLASFPVVLSTPTFMEGLTELLAATSQLTVMDYMKFHRVASYAAHLTKEYQDANFELSKVLHGVEEEPARWKTCLGRTDGRLGFALGKLFVDLKFPGNSKDTAEVMIQGIKDAFKEGLDELDWMTTSTIEKARSKADHMLEKIGYPSFIQEKDELDAHYEDLIITDNYLQNIYDYRLWDAQRNFDDLVKPVDKTRWDMSPSTVNAYYNPSNNEIVFPAGIMQPPFFANTFLQAINYGGMGVVMGHELTHGFDDQGAQYDENGDLGAWWDDSVTVEFEKKTSCVANLYSKYQIDSGEFVNGNLTLGENIADNGGLKEAYRAYQAWTKDNGAENTLPGLPHTPNQLFFLGFAQVWCSVATTEYEQISLDTDPHSPPKYRVIGTLSNSHDFAEAWKCDKGAKMNPTEKCDVW